MRGVRAGVAAFTLLCFALPWLLVSCQGKPVYQASGLRLMLGFDYSTSGGVAHTTANPWVIAAAVFLLLVFLVALFSRAADQRSETVLSAVLFGAAAGCLVVFRPLAGVENVFLTTTYTYGYYLALAGTVAGAIVCVVAAFRGSPSSPT